MVPLKLLLSRSLMHPALLQPPLSQLPPTVQRIAKKVLDGKYGRFHRMDRIFRDPSFKENKLLAPVLIANSQGIALPTVGHDSSQWPLAAEAVFRAEMSLLLLSTPQGIKKLPMIPFMGRGDTAISTGGGMTIMCWKVIIRILWSESKVTQFGNFVVNTYLRQFTGSEHSPAQWPVGPWDLGDSIWHPGCFDLKRIPPWWGAQGVTPPPVDTSIL
ncbi:hypothetical protein B0H14DRAFT_2590217 [Mycena olivaceomarginata]|nr:hypothetical protein B0H14DRAFT_2590217 [Mycena olivaceomarginata]